MGWNVSILGQLKAVAHLGDSALYICPQLFKVESDFIPKIQANHNKKSVHYLIYVAKLVVLKNKVLRQKYIMNFKNSLSISLVGKPRIIMAHEVWTYYFQNIDYCQTCSNDHLYKTTSAETAQANSHAIVTV